jgi:hypothetical protein
LKRKLLLLNLALMAVTVAAGVHLRREWLAARAREQAVLMRRLRPAPPPPVSALPAAEPVKPAGYIDIAQKMLFSKDRNPTVIVEPVKAPPPKPMPPLPVFHGLLNVGDGLTAIMSVKAGAQHLDFRAGEQVGEYKLVAFNEQEVMLEWDGKTFTKKVEELADHSAPPPAPSPMAAVTPAGAPPPPPAPPVTPKAMGPGKDTGRGIAMCQAGDTSPAGTIADGMRKVLKDGLFGKTCYWEPAN